MEEKGSEPKRRVGIGPAALAILVYAGQLKLNPLLGWFPGDLTVALVVVVILSSLVTRWHWGPPSGCVVLPYMVWVAFLPAVWLSPWGEYAQSKISTLFTITLVLAVAPFYLLRRSEQRRRFLSTLVVISVFVVTYSLFFDQDIGVEYSTGLAFDGADTIGTGRIAMTGAIICVIFALSGNVRAPARLSLLAVAVVTALLAVLSGSRGPLLGILIALAIVVLFAPGFKSKRGIGVLLLGFVALAVVGLAASDPTDGTNRAFSVFAGETDTSVDARFRMWEAAWEQMASSPGGSGWGGFESPSPRNPYPHNLMLEIGVEAGIVVAVFFIAFILKTLVKATQVANSVVQMSMLGLMVFGLFNALVSSDINGGRLFIVTLFAVWAALDNERRKTPRGAGVSPMEFP